MAGWLLYEGQRLPTGYRNCNRCSRWRPISDFGYGSRYIHTSGLVTVYAKSWCTHCEARLKRERYPKRTPEQVQRQREYNREWITSRRREQGIEPRVAGPKNSGNYGGGRIKGRAGYKESVDPFPILREAERAGYNRREIAIAARVSERRVYGWYEEGVRMELDAADRLCFALGVHLSLIYGCE